YISAEQLQKAIEESPYNSAAYFLLAKKLYLSNDSAYENALQKAALHFSNDQWLNFILNEDDITVTERWADAPVKENQQTEEAKSLTEEIINEEDVVNESENGFKQNVIETDTSDDKLSSMLKEQAAALEKTIEPTAELPIENMAYHRVDYFGSQGIKLEEDKADDKLGTQLKRFTDWLKQMKRINQNPAELASDEAGETRVKSIAEHSNEPEEVTTEAMAEVLIKQGKPQQAIQIYQKLSFNNPLKSAYFAAKIEELKG
ncbi:MAG: hypothetical protein JO072_00565, partial [Parafilimonas sp.]|nr:hypothetical protein [Parafilimonas sp.]